VHVAVPESRRVSRRWPVSPTGAAGSTACATHSAAPYFEHRLPEVVAGDAASMTSIPVAFPTASRPQAWAAGTPLLLLSTLLGPEPGYGDAKAGLPGGIGQVELRPSVTV